MDELSKIYYMRTFLGSICGVILGFVLNPSISSNIPLTVGITFMAAIFFYIISYFMAKRIGLNIKNEDKKKILTSGIIPFIFLLFMFMIIIYTGLHAGEKDLIDLRV